MSGPYFSTWERENLIKFCQESYEKLQRQEEELQELRWVKQERSSLADALYERIEEEMQINEELRQQTAMRERLAQPQWQGLTDRQVEEIARHEDEHGSGPWHLAFARAIEAKLKEQNA